MLILARKVNERIIIGDPGDDQIELAVVEIRGDQVKLGIQAPKHIKVYRREVYAAIQQENVAAAGARPEHVPELPELPALDPDRQRDSATGDAGGGS